MLAVNIHEAKTHFSSLLRAAERGEEVTIARAGVPVARLVPIQAPHRTKRIGFLADLSLEVPADFDTMLADEIEAEFAGNASV